jgi:PIN domain nuclease of toxin-antitoxin system
MRTFLDTHAWIWWVTGDRRLSRRARSAIRRATGRDGVWLSAISIWEVAKRVEKQQLVLDRPLRDWLSLALSSPGLLVAELTTDILLESCNLPQPFHGDPADQMIAATVREHNGMLITRDEAMHQYPHLRCLW